MGLFGLKQYANANPVMYTDPSGNFSFSLGSFSASFSVQGSLATMSYGAAPSIGNLVIGGVLRPIATTAASHVSGAAIAGLFYATAVNYCQNNDRCKPPMPVIFYGSAHGELTQHILDAQTGKKEASALLHRMPRNGWRRGWLGSKIECNPKARAKYPQTMDCDEYPFNSSREGGPNNYPDRVSLRLINPEDNQDGGRLLGGMYRSDGVATGDQFLVLAHTSLPLSFYITRQGKFRTTRGPNPDDE